MSYHPAGRYARQYLLELPTDRLDYFEQLFQSNALRGGELATANFDALKSMRNGRRLDDTAALGLAWTIFRLECKFADEEKAANALAKQRGENTNGG